MGVRLLEFKSVSYLVLGAALFTACAPTQFGSTPAVPNSSTQIIDPPPVTVKKLNESFLQGNSGNQLDILIVNDNSISMDPEQRKLGARFSSFVSSIADIDYHIGMTTTDLDSPNFNQGGRLLTWTGTTETVLTPNTPNASQVFLNSVIRQETLNCDGTVANCPSGNEQPLLATIAAVGQRFTANAGFFRDKAPLIVVVLSDEDELSTASSSATSSAEVMNAVTASFGVTKTFVFFGIVVKPGDASCLAAQKAQDNGTASFGTRAAELAMATGGKTISICENDFAKPLAGLSRSMRKLVTTFALKKAPKHGKLSVQLTPKKDIAYTVEGNKLVFDAPPPIGTRIDVSYDDDET